MSKKASKKESKKETHQIIVNCIKNYHVVRKSTYQSEPFYADVSGIAAWFYQSYPQLDDITITIYGGFHVTYPNPQHITVVISAESFQTERLHMSIDENGYWYQQTVGENYSQQGMLNAYGNDKVTKKKSRNHKRMKKSFKHKATKRKATKRKATKHKATKRKATKHKAT